VNNLFNNPLVKTIITGIAAVAIPAIDAAMQNPTGGTLAALQHDPVYAYLFTGAALLIHNLYSHLQGGTTPPASGK